MSQMALSQKELSQKLISETSHRHIAILGGLLTLTMLLLWPVPSRDQRSIAGNSDRPTLLTTAAKPASHLTEGSPSTCMAKYVRNDPANLLDSKRKMMLAQIEACRGGESK